MKVVRTVPVRERQVKEVQQPMGFEGRVDEWEVLRLRGGIPHWGQCGPLFAAETLLA